MPEPKKSSAMVPLIIIGACLFGFGTYQSMKPKATEVNSGFVAGPQNPRTLQAPDAPPMTKDAAQMAAEADQITTPMSKAEAPRVKLAITEAPWMQGIMTGAFGNFREGVLKVLKAEQAKGGINCAPVLTDISSIEKISCTTKDGAQITGEFDASGDGEFTVEDPSGGRVQVSKNNGDFNVETRDAP